MVVVRPIWLCTCFSKDQAPLVDDLFWWSWFIWRQRRMSAVGNWALEVISTLPSDSMKRMAFKVVLSSVGFFWTKLLHWSISIYPSSVSIIQARSSLIEDDSNYGCRLMLFDIKRIEHEINQRQTRSISINVVDFLMTCALANSNYSEYCCSFPFFSNLLEK